ncbi:unnamed protein product [Ascophyllum nodosum]
MLVLLALHRIKALESQKPNARTLLNSCCRNSLRDCFLWTVPSACVWKPLKIVELALSVDGDARVAVVDTIPGVVGTRISPVLWPSFFSVYTEI